MCKTKEIRRAGKKHTSPPLIYMFVKVPPDNLRVLRIKSFFFFNTEKPAAMIRGRGFFIARNYP